MPMDYGLYPPGWRRLAKQVKEAGDWRCIRCGLAQGEETLNRFGQPIKRAWRSSVRAVTCAMMRASVGGGAGRCRLRVGNCCCCQVTPSIKESWRGGGKKKCGPGAVLNNRTRARQAPCHKSIVDLGLLQNEGVPAMIIHMLVAFVQWGGMELSDPYVLHSSR
jgi:hypothetical protein